MRLFCIILRIKQFYRQERKKRQIVCGTVSHVSVLSHSGSSQHFKYKSQSLHLHLLYYTLWTKPKNRRITITTILLQFKKWCQNITLILSFLLFILLVLFITCYHCVIYSSTLTRNGSLCVRRCTGHKVPLP